LRVNLVRRAISWGFNVWIGIILGFATGFAWIMVGGIPHGIDKYGIVPIPGQAEISLPQGRILLDHFDDVYDCRSKNSSIPKVPAGTQVHVARTDNPSERLKVTHRSDRSYIGITGCRGHDPFGRIDVLYAGTYRIEVTDAQSRQHGQAIGQRFGGPHSGPGISFGNPPWTPFGIPIIGAALAAVLVGLVGWKLADLIWGET
jgi:hypothetical protein